MVFVEFSCFSPAECAEVIESSEFCRTIWGCICQAVAERPNNVLLWFIIITLVEIVEGSTDPDSSLSYCYFLHGSLFDYQ